MHSQAAALLSFAVILYALRDGLLDGMIPKFPVGTPLVFLRKIKRLKQVQYEERPIWKVLTQLRGSVLKQIWPMILANGILGGSKPRFMCCRSASYASLSKAGTSGLGSARHRACCHASSCANSLCCSSHRHDRALLRKGSPSGFRKDLAVALPSARPRHQLLQRLPQLHQLRPLLGGLAPACPSLRMLRLCGRLCCWNAGEDGAR